MTKQTDENTKNIAVIKEQLEDIKEDMEEILKNHLPHLRKDMKDLRENYIVFKAKALFLWGLAIIVISILLNKLADMFL